MAEIDALFLAFQGALAGRYSLERELGRGGMGVVYLAREVRLDRSVAIKLLPPEFSSDARLRDRFMREARMAAGLSHPYIVPIFSVDEIDGYVFYVMAYVDGETLAHRVATRGPVPPGELTRIAREVAWALAYAHAQGIVHRDIKPANILIERGTGRAMVMDFGIARLAQTGGETAVGEVLGTPEYMSPEQASGEALDGRSDLYSLGITAYYALSGTLPFSAPNAHAVLAQHLTKEPPALATVARGVPRALAQVIDRCLQKAPAARYDTGEALADALAPALDKVKDVPVPVRVFLDRRRAFASIFPPLFLLPLSSKLLDASLRRGASPWAFAALATAYVAAFAIPVGAFLYRLRSLLRLGYGPDDLVAGLRASYDRRREEFQFSYGAERSLREKLFRTVGLIGLASPLPAALAFALHYHRPAVAALGIFGLYIGVLASSFSSRWRRLRDGSGSMWMRLWQGKWGRTAARIAGYKLGARAVAADRPTEMAIAMSAEALYASFSKDVRQSLGDVPEVLRELETRARAVRARIEFVDASLTEAQNQNRAASSERQNALVNDLRESRAVAEKGLSDVVTALENLRLDLLRLRAGAGTAEGITRDIAAAREVGEGVDRLISGQHAVEKALH